MALNQLEGLDSLLAKLDAVSKEIKFKGGRFGLRKAANLIADKAREGAHAIDDATTGRSIADNIAVRWSPRTFKRNGNLMFRVGVLGGAILLKDPSKATSAPTPHWRLLEFGTENMRAQPFMRAAMAENADAAMATFAREAEKSIDRAIKKAGKA